MTKRYLYLLLSISFCATAAQAQVKPAVKKTAAKPVQKKAAAKPAAQKLGDAAAKVKQDTTKKGGQTTPANQPGNGGSLSEEIVVTTVYKPVLADAVKIRRNPNLDDTQPYKAPLSYTTLDKKLERNTDIRQLEAMPRPTETDSVPYNNYVRAGFGSLRTLFGEAYVNNGKDGALQTGAYAKHFSQHGSDYNKQNQGRTDIGVFGKSILDQHTLTGRITYNNRSTYFYGYNGFDPAVPADPQRQSFITIAAEGELVKNYQDTDRAFTYNAKLSGYLFSDALKARENNVVFTGFINQTINQFYAGLAGSIDVATQKDVNYSINNSLLRLNPYLKFQGENYKIDAGVNIVKEFGVSNRFSIFPAAKVELQVIPQYVRLFAEAKGDINRTSLRSLSELNPFMNANLDIKNSVDKLDIAVGLKGMLAPGLGFKASVFRNSVQDLPLFVSHILANGNNRFDVIYALGRTRINGFNGELDYKASDDVNVFGRVEFKDYQLNNNEQAWNLPKFKLTAGTAIHINNKIDINGSLVFRGDVKDRILTPVSPTVTNTQVYNLKSFADLNGGVSYKATRQVSIFVQANNILNNKYQTYLYYPNYGFNIFGGAGFTF